MFNFFSSFKEDVKKFMAEVKSAFEAVTGRIVALENQVKTLMGDKVDAAAKGEQQASNSEQHQNGEGSGQAHEAGSGDSAQHSA